MVDLKKRVVDYVEPVFRFCLKRLADRRDAEDLSQEILVHVLDGIGRYDIKNIDAWVWQIARNRYARFVDFKGKESELQLKDGYVLDKLGDYDVVEEVVIKEEHRAVFAALHTLSARYRNVIVDYYLHGVSVAGIADKYDIPQTTVKWRLHSGREQIRERMGNMKKVYNRINWYTKDCNGSMDSNRYLYSQIARAICLAAYEKPVTIEEISLATGLPTMYIEDEIPRLIYGDAVVENGNKYSANFIILRLEDSRKMIKEFAPHISDVVDRIGQSMHDNEEEIRRIGFYGCDSGVDRLGYIITPVVLRKTVRYVQQSSEKLKQGPYPPRKDGGYGWFIVYETEDYSEDMQLTSSGNNAYFDREIAERGLFTYLWLGKYFSTELYRQGMGWMFTNDLMLKVKNGYVPNRILNDEDLVRLLRLNLIQRCDGGYRLNIPIFTKEQFNELVALFDVLVDKLKDMLNDLVVKIWEQFHSNVPRHLHDQINQYVASYVNNIVGFVVYDMIDRGILAPPPEQVPLVYGLFFIDRPTDWQI